MNKIIFEEKDKETIKYLIDKYFASKIYFNNYFGIGLEGVNIFVTSQTLVLRKEFEGFFRIYIISTEVNDLENVLKNIPTGYIINIPSKKDISNLINLFIKTGFNIEAVYKRYNYRKIRKAGIFKGQYAKDYDFDLIKDLLYKNFSPITGHLPNDIELEKMINNNSIIVNRDEEKRYVNGLIGLKIEGEKCYLPFWVDNDGNGLGLLYDVFATANESKCKEIYFWINAENKPTITLHEKLGAKPDGLADYVLIKN